LNVGQVLKLKSLLSRAEIEKRSLQQQLDLKVRTGAADARAWALTLSCFRLLKIRTWRAFATSCCQAWKKADLPRIKMRFELDCGAVKVPPDT
jgi:hypothetical protein